MNLANIPWPTGSNNTGGLAQKIFIVNAEDVDTVPEPVQTNPLSLTGTLTDLVTVSGNLVLKAGKQMYEVYLTLETGEIKHDPQGAVDGKSFKNVLDITHPGSSALALGFLSYIKNGSFYLILKEVGGNVRLLGTKDFPAKVSELKGTSGKATADLKHSTIQFYSCGNTPAPIFTGNVMVGATLVPLEL